MYDNKIKFSIDGELIINKVDEEETTKPISSNQLKTLKTPVDLHSAIVMASYVENEKMYEFVAEAVENQINNMETEKRQLIRNMIIVRKENMISE